MLAAAFSPASPRGTLYSHTSLSFLICYWLCVRANLYERLVFVFCDDEEMLIQLWPRGCDFSMMRAGKCSQRHTLTGEKVIFHTACLHSGYFWNAFVTSQRWRRAGSVFSLLTGVPFDETELKGPVHPLSPYFYPLTQRVCKTKAKGSRVMKWQCSQWLIQAEACFVVGQECAD